MPQGNSVSPVGPEILSQWTGHITQCWVPVGKSLLWLCTSGTHYHQLALKYHCSGLVILFNVECPRESLLSLCPRENQYPQLAMKYHHQWIADIVQCWVPPGKSGGGLHLFNDGTCPTRHISRPTHVDVSNSCFHSLNRLIKPDYLSRSGG